MRVFYFILFYFYLLLFFALFCFLFFAVVVADFEFQRNGLHNVPNLYLKCT